jgi:hypothetical protein
MKDLLSRGQAASSQVSDQPYTGGFVAAPGQGAFDAASQMAGVGQSLQGIGTDVLNLGQSTARGDFLRPESNPFLASYANAIRDEAGRTYQMNRRGVTSGNIAAGAYGGDRGQLAQSDYASRAAQQTNDLLTNLYYSNYLAERQLQQQAPSLIQSGAGLQLLSPEIGMQAAESERGLRQLGLDEQIAQFNENAAAPFRPLQPYANLIYGAAPIFGNSATSVTGQPAGAGNAAQIIQALLGAGAIAGSFA